MSGFLATLSLSVGLSTFGFSPEKKQKYLYYCAAQIMTFKLLLLIIEISQSFISFNRTLKFLIKLVGVKTCRGKLECLIYEMLWTKNKGRN